MPEMRWTPSQKAAIDAPVMDLLVSAAAGSGKTAVLAARILRLLADPGEKTDISRMLAVTFTKASASELRVRIAGALKKEMAALLSSAGSAAEGAEKTGDDPASVSKTGRAERADARADNEGNAQDTADPHYPDDAEKHAAQGAAADRADNAAKRDEDSADAAGKIAGYGGESTKMRRYRRIEEQLGKIDLAEISTIHSFCYSLIRRHFSALGLPASLRIADEAESELLMRRTMEETIDALYEEDPAFPAFAESLIELQDDRLSELFLGFYKKFVAAPEGLELVHICAERLKEAAADFSDSLYAQVILRAVSSFADYYAGVLSASQKELALDDKAKKAYGGAFEEDVRFLKGLSAEKDFFAAAAAANAFSPARLGAYRGPKPAAVEEALLFRRDFQAALRELKKRFFLFDRESAAKDASLSAAYTETLYRLLTAFSARYTAEKRRYGILDYNDLELYAHRLLLDRGCPTPLAEALALRYDAVFIDEYQDTNAMQDEIFSSFSRHNRFMVGDIKQSIYGFRGAMPEIFSRYRSAFPAYREGQGQEAATIFLSENFRSDRSVIEYANRVFAVLFCHNSGRVPYLPNDALVCARPADEDAGLPVRFLLADRDALDEAGAPLTEEDMVADEILALLREGVRPSEIVILLRNMNAAEKFRQALTEREVACQSGKNEDSLFDCPEVLLLIALLNTLDNPTRDIYLAAVLKSPLFGFTLGELIGLRRAFPGKTLYESLSLFRDSFAEGGGEEDGCLSEGGDCVLTDGEKTQMPAGGGIEEEAGAENAFAAPAQGEEAGRASREEKAGSDTAWEGGTELREKGEAFFAFLLRARRYAERKSADKVVRYLLRVTPLRAVAVKNTGSGANLTLFYDFVRSFEANGFKGVHGLIERINALSSDKAVSPPSVRRPVDLSAVRIMTIHQSKGCEFEYVFLCDTARRFNTKEKSAPLVYEKSLGIGLKLREAEGFVKYDTLIREAVAVQGEENALDEEMRILYVALTRAKRQLTITAAKGGPRAQSCADFLKETALRGKYPHTRLFLEGESYAEWLLLACPGQPVTVVRSRAPAAAAPLCGAAGKIKKESSPVPERILAERLAYRYPGEAVASLPAKLSVSRLYPGILDDDAEELIRSEKAGFDRLPLFMQDRLEADGAERGTATHLFMQFCDFQKVAATGVDREIERLVKEAFLTPGIAGLILRDRLKRFFAGPLFQKILSAKKVLREERFNVRMPAAEFTLDPARAAVYEDETILVQGVIDCLLVEEDGGLVLIDYKTDRTPADRKAAESLLRKRYTVQLSYYRRAIEKLYGAKVRKTWIYSFFLNDVVEIR